MTKPKMTAAQSSAKLAEDCKRVAENAFDESVSRSTTLEGLAIALRLDPTKKTHRPSKTIFGEVRQAYIAGRMAGVLPSNGTATDRIANAVSLLTQHQGATGTGKLRKGMIGRRTEDQERAYGNAREWWRAACADLGVISPDAKKPGKTAKSTAEKNASNRTPKPGSNPPETAPEVKTPKQAQDVLAKQKATTKAAGDEFIAGQVKMLDAYQRKNAATLSNRATAAIAAFVKTWNESA